MTYNNTIPFHDRPVSSQKNKLRKHHRRNLSLDMDAPEMHSPNMETIPEIPQHHRMMRTRPASPMHDLMPKSVANKNNARKIVLKGKTNQSTIEEPNGPRSTSPKKDRLIMLVGHKNKEGRLEYRKKIINKVNLSYNFKE